MGAVFSNGLRLDSSLTLAIKATVQAEETATILSPKVNLADAAMAEAQAALLESLEPDRVAKQVQRTAVRVGKELAQRAPSLETAALKWIDLFNKGKIVVEVDTSQLSRAIEQVGGLGKQATTGLIVVGQLIGTAIAMIILLQPALSQFIGFAYLAMIAFGVTLLVSFWVLFRMLFGRDDGGSS
jgi:predicted unusual protein kinase regulating ubiquinone biosynthesis (AarF/ABC1/UbiB family)